MALPVDGAVITVPPDVSQVIPLDNNVAEQESELPPLIPSQGHVHGPVPDTAPAVPTAQRLVVGAVEKLPPSADPHTPSAVIVPSANSTGVDPSASCQPREPIYVD